MAPATFCRLLRHCANHWLISHLSLCYVPMEEASPKLEDLMNDIASKIPAMWRVVGVQLGLSTWTLDGIQGETTGAPQSNLHSFEKVLNIWRQQKSKPYTWTTIITVLQTPTVGQVALAEEIQAKCIEREKN